MPAPAVVSPRWVGAVLKAAHCRGKPGAKRPLAIHPRVPAGALPSSVTGGAPSRPSQRSNIGTQAQGASDASTPSAAGPH